MTRLLWGFVCCWSAWAHEIGTTRVTAVMKDGAYSIEVVTDADALREKLGEGDFAETFRSRVKIQFDAAEVRPSITHSVADGAATVRLTGEIPEGARNFRWSYGWTFASYALKVQGETVWLEGSQLSRAFALGEQTRPNVVRTLWRYVVLGFTHIVPEGLDHMLFVLGIYLLSGRARAVLWQVSAFTLAHSITLALSMLGWISVPASIVEPLIALSIVYVAVENIFLSELKSWRVALVFTFGLLHGMGFAGALRELDLPRSEFATALLGFNVGVEAGQLAVIAAAFLVMGWHWSDRVWYRSRVVVPLSCLIACMAVYWTVERLIPA